MLMRVFALYLCYTLSTRDAMVAEVSKMLVLEQITFIFGVPSWCCFLNCCARSAQCIQVWDAVGSFSGFAFELLVCMNKSEKLVSVTYCSYRNVCAMISRFYHVGCLTYINRTSAVFYCLPMVCGLKREFCVPFILLLFQ